MKICVDIADEKSRTVCDHMLIASGNSPDYNILDRMFDNIRTIDLLQ